MEGDIFTIVQALELVAHIFEQQPFLVGIAFQSPFQEAKDEFHL